MGWLLLVKYRQLSRKQDELTTSFLKFKRSPELLINALNNQQPHDILPFKNELLLGNPKATLQLVIACAPFCEPCARVHQMLHALLEKQPLAFGISVRFTHSEEDKHIPKGEAAIYILQTIHTHIAAINDQAEKSIITGKILHDWYTLMNLQAFRQLYPLQQKVDINESLEEHITWWQKAEIMYTPTVFVNGYNIPAPYNIYDAAIIFPILSEYLESKKKQIEKVIYLL
jgi:thiol-disulfide isomerase/thioredoxin